MVIPFLRPSPPRLTELSLELAVIEESGVFSNYGPVNTRFEKLLTERLFGGFGDCVTVCNATIGLMLAIREAAGEPPPGERRYALMPSFTFAATAHAAIWAGFTPLLCDIDPDTWLPSVESEEELLRAYHGQVAVVVPYATFGNNLDTVRYAQLSREHGVPVVVDAAASLGSLDWQGRGFGTAAEHAIVFSMHTTKTFATAEAGVIYCGDAERVARLRRMGNFGFGVPRTATMPGLNSKLSEIGALLAMAKLEHFPEIVEHRAALAAAYRARLPELSVQRRVGERLAYQFMPMLLPEHLAPRQAEIVERLGAHGIGVARYFSPHLHDQPYFRERCVAGDLSTTERISHRTLSLPMSDTMTEVEVETVCAAMRQTLKEVA